MLVRRWCKTLFWHYFENL